jgi:thiol:disulfide interchange protein
MLKNPGYVWMVIGVMILSFISACSRQMAPITQNGAEKSTIDLDRLAAEAKTQNKNVYMEFTSSWCIFCRSFENGVLSTPESQAALRKVIFIQVDYDQNPDLDSQYSVSAVPTGLLLKPQNGRLQAIDRHVGRLNQKKFIQFISK